MLPQVEFECLQLCAFCIHVLYKVTILQEYNIICELPATKYNLYYTIYNISNV